MTDLSTAVVAVTGLVSKYGTTRDEMIDVLGGPADGGPGADGLFPVTLENGSTLMVPSARRIEAVASAADHTRLTLADLKAAPITDATSFYEGALWVWTPGDFTGQADQLSLVKSDSVPLDVGAWRRQPGAFTVPPTASPEGTTAALQQALQPSPISDIQLDGRTYDLGSGTFAWGLSNVRVRGVPGLTKITTTAPALVYFLSVHDVVIEDVIFECTGTIPGDDYRGIINVFDEVVTRLTFRRCIFTAPAAAINAIKFVNEKPGAFVESVHFVDCIIADVGRMGLEVQNHPASPIDTVKRYRDIRWIGGRIARTGLVSVNGQAVSFSGYGSECSVDDTLFDDNLLACVENVGCSVLRISGTTRNIHRQCDVLSYTGNRPMNDCIIEQFRTLDKANGSALLRTCPGLIVRDVVLDLVGSVALHTVSDARFSAFTFRCGGGIALFVEGYAATGGSRRNFFTNGRIDAGGAVTAFAAVRFYGDGVNFNAIEGTEIVQGSAGVLADEQAGARLNRLTGRVIGGAALPASKTLVTFYSDDNAAFLSAYAITDWEAAAQTIASSVALTAVRTAIVPTGIVGLHVIRNATSGGQAVVIAQADGAATVQIPQGEARTVYFDAQGVHQA